MARLVQQVAQRGLDNDILLKVNVQACLRAHQRRTGNPPRPPRLPGQADRAPDPRGRKYYWMGGTEVLSTHEEGTDATACEHGYVSITPIHLDLTNHKLLDRLRTWDLRF